MSKSKHATGRPKTRMMSFFALPSKPSTKPTTGPGRKAHPAAQAEAATSTISLHPGYPFPSLTPQTSTLLEHTAETARLHRPSTLAAMLADRNEQVEAHETNVLYTSALESQREDLQAQIEKLKAGHEALGIRVEQLLAQNSAWLGLEFELKVALASQTHRLRCKEERIAALERKLRMAEHHARAAQSEIQSGTSQHVVGEARMRTLEARVKRQAEILRPVSDKRGWWKWGSQGTIKVKIAALGSRLEEMVLESDVLVKECEASPKRLDVTEEKALVAEDKLRREW